MVTYSGNTSDNNNKVLLGQIMELSQVVQV